jgi:hypothetical protein
MRENETFQTADREAFQEGGFVSFDNAGGFCGEEKRHQRTVEKMSKIINHGEKLESRGRGSSQMMWTRGSQSD